MSFYSCVGWDHFPKGYGFGSLLVAFFGLQSVLLVAFPGTLILCGLRKFNATRLITLVVSAYVVGGPLLAYLFRGLREAGPGAAVAT